MAVGERRGNQDNDESEQIWRGRKGLRGKRGVTHTVSELVSLGCCNKRVSYE